MNAVQIVQRMMDVLDCDEHWCKNILETWGPQGTKQYCLLGAANLVTTGSSWHGPGDLTVQEMSAKATVIETMDKLAEQRGYVHAKNPVFSCGTGANAVRFNNAPETTYEDLRLFLKETLVELEIQSASH